MNSTIFASELSWNGAGVTCATTESGASVIALAPNGTTFSGGAGAPIIGEIQFEGLGLTGHQCQMLIHTASVFNTNKASIKAVDLGAAAVPSSLTFSAATGTITGLYQVTLYR